MRFPDLKDLGKLVHGLVSKDDDKDMSVIEKSINVALENRGFKFRDINEFDSDFALWVQKNFDNVGDMFYDMINTKRISEDSVQELIELCIK